MQGLWADGWFYISSAGLLVSGVLFFFLLSQYRAASEASDAADLHEPAHEAETSVAVTPVRPVAKPSETAPAKVASIPVEEKPAPAPAPRPAAAPAPAPAAETPAAEKRRPETTTGGLSPAVVYLQNIKLQLDKLDKDMRGLTERVDSITSRDEALIERLGELTQAVADLRSAAAAPAPAPAEAPAPAPAPKRARRAEPKPEPVAEPAPAPEPKAEPKQEPAAEPELKIELSPEPPKTAKEEPKPEPKPEPASDATVRLSPEDAAAVRAAVEAPKAEPAPETPKTEPSPETAENPEPESKPRRGPVWPV